MTEAINTQENALPEWADTDTLDESGMDRQYLQAEARFRGEARRFYDQEMELRKRVRRSIDLDDADREVVYMVEHQRIEEEFNQVADAFTNQWLDRRRRAYEAVYRNQTDGFRDAVLRTANMSEEELERTLDIAMRSGQRDLASAVAQTALSRNMFGIFDRWGRENPQAASNLQTLRKTPGFSQLEMRVHKASKPPRVEEPHQLRPGAEELQWAEDQERNSRINVDVRKFFRGRASRRERIRPRS